NTVLNTSVAEALKQFADTLEGAADFETSLHNLIRETIKKHKRIIFNGDGYDDAWVAEANKRGLLNLKSTPDAIAHLLDEKNIKLFTEHKVYSETELTARHEVLLENYCKVINIEALTMLDMVRKDILPAMSAYSAELTEAASKKTALFPDADCSYEKDCVKSLCAMIGTAHRTVKKMEQDLLTSKSIEDMAALADYYKTTILDDMRSLRIAADEMETIASAEKWPYPSYGELLFGVR
ncbi:MAG: glutamine synthetase type III, partial [Clostridia bacterium]